MSDISNSADIIDVRDVIERLEELEEATHDDDGNQLTLDEDDASEFSTLTELLSDLKGYGGDEQWRGDWYPLTLIHEDYFATYARELADDICEPSPSGMSWPFNRIDWEAAAEDLQMDYSSVEYVGVTYWYR